ncbi:hypothetical protein BJ508DRAFT_350371 [Ascobolus immersus RN42]|uniref:Uncharacterized protein n=1 Tax=Ascobolus immersus RN42 TaxID=1160509 RepID=A0A3N4II55_ASCIM|nr:hypothetical protein BJ508DRAFT_350371 [Ascobolus immersus RN42]
MKEWSRIIPSVVQRFGTNQLERRRLTVERHRASPTKATHGSSLLRQPRGRKTVDIPQMPSDGFGSRRNRVKPTLSIRESRCPTQSALRYTLRPSRGQDYSSPTVGGNGVFATLEVDREKEQQEKRSQRNSAKFGCERSRLIDCDRCKSWFSGHRCERRKEEGFECVAAVFIRVVRGFVDLLLSWEASWAGPSVWALYYSEYFLPNRTPPPFRYGLKLGALLPNRAVWKAPPSLSIKPNKLRHGDGSFPAYTTAGFRPGTAADSLENPQRRGDIQKIGQMRRIWLKWKELTLVVELSTL